MSHHDLIRKGAITGLLGFVLSGPVAVLVVMLWKPQPEWDSVTVYIANYHPVQMLPYLLGFLLLAGMMMLSTGHFLVSRSSPERIRIHAALSHFLFIVFFALITFNYICQTTFVHNLVRHYRPEYEPLIAGFSMSNPASFCWANEMWGYALLGIGTWLLASFYSDRSQGVRTLLIGNGIISLISPVWTIMDPGWVFRPVGMGLYLFWNIWMIILMIMILRVMPKE